MNLQLTYTEKVSQIIIKEVIDLSDTKIWNNNITEEERLTIISEYNWNLDDMIDDIIRMSNELKARNDLIETLYNKLSTMKGAKSKK